MLNYVWDMGFKGDKIIIDWIYYIEIASRIVLLTDSDLLRYFKKAKGDWTYFIAIMLRYFPNVVVCILSNSKNQWHWMISVELYLELTVWIDKYDNYQ